MITLWCLWLEKRGLREQSRVVLVTRMYFTNSEFSKCNIIPPIKLNIVLGNKCFQVILNIQVFKVNECTHIESLISNCALPKLSVAINIPNLKMLELLKITWPFILKPIIYLTSQSFNIHSLDKITAISIAWPKNLFDFRIKENFHDLDFISCIDMLDEFENKSCLF